MATSEKNKGIPQPVSTRDLEGLASLVAMYDEHRANDVSVIRGEPVHEIIERSGNLHERIAQELGGASSDKTIKIGFVELGEDEKMLLESGRRVMPISRRLY